MKLEIVSKKLLKPNFSNSAGRRRLGGNILKLPIEFLHFFARGDLFQDLLCRLGQEGTLNIDLGILQNKGLN